MQVEVAETGPCSRTLTIQIPPASVQEHLDAMYASAARQVNMKGFRPGKVPRKLLEKQYGPEILREAKEQLVNRSFSEACRQKELSPVGRVRIDGFEKLEVRLGSMFEYRVELDVRPKFDLQAVKGLRVDPFETVATTADVDNALQEIANQKRSIKPVASPAQDGDFVKVDLLFQDAQGERVHERKGVQLNTRIPVAGTDPAEFAKALQGATAGQTIELAVTFPPNFEKDAFRGKQGKAVLQVHEVLRVQAAPVDDALAKSLDFDSIEALRADLETRIGQEKVKNGKLRQEEQCLQQLLERHDFPLPGSLVEDQQQTSLASFRERLKQSGMADEEIEKKLVESKDEAQQDARRRVRLFFLIDAIAQQQKLFVTENDIEAELRNVAAANNATPEQVREYLEKSNRLGELRLGLLERKVREFLRESAKTVDKKGN